LLAVPRQITWQQPLMQHGSTSTHVATIFVTVVEWSLKKILLIHRRTDTEAESYLLFITTYLYTSFLCSNYSSIFSSMLISESVNMH
jgi:hypothetical protein